MSGRVVIAFKGHGKFNKVGNFERSERGLDEMKEVIADMVMRGGLCRVVGVKRKETPGDARKLVKAWTGLLMRNQFREIPIRPDWADRCFSLPQIKPDGEVSERYWDVLDVLEDEVVTNKSQWARLSGLPRSTARRYMDLALRRGEARWESGRYVMTD